jgi:oligogalacturonide lyase
MKMKTTTTNRKVLLMLGLCLLLQPCQVSASNVGKRYPSEKFTIRDSVTGRTLTVLTASSYSDAKPYQPHDTWTADGSWIVFRSARGDNGSQLFLVHEETGEIVQLTDDPAVNAGSVNLSRREMKLFYLRGGAMRGRVGDTIESKPRPRQLVELNIGLLLDDSKAGKLKKPDRYERVVVTFPDTLRVGGMALDADEQRLYVSVSFGRFEPPQAAPRRREGQPQDSADNRSRVDSRNTDPTESREAARVRFAEAGKGSSGIRAVDVATGKITEVINVPLRMGHLQANPWTPGEIIYCHETTGDAVQRIWAVNADGSNHRPIYVETPDEWITHETVAGADELMFNIMGHLPYLREHPTGIAVINLRTKQMKLLGQVEEEMGRGMQGGFWHCNGSPDGKWAAGDTFRGSVYLINRATGERTLLTTGHRMRPDHTHPIFSRDSRRVLIQSGMLTEGKALNLMVMTIEE